MPLCPFCLERPVDSDDHVFPQFLGGQKATVPACRRCNNHEFGSRIEGPASRTLSPFFVAMEWCGIDQPGEALWRKAIVHDGLEYDLSGSMRATLSKPKIERDANGKFIGGRFPIGHPPPDLGPDTKVKIERQEREIDLARSDFQMDLDAGLRPLSVKMAVGLCLHQGLDRKHVAQSVFDYLRAPKPRTEDVGQDYRVHQALDALVPHLSHVIYVYGSPETGHLFGVVQFFSAFQFYVPLHTAYGGPTVSWLATVNVKTLEESFTEIPALGIEPLPAQLPQDEMMLGETNWFARFNLRLAEHSKGRHFTVGPAHLKASALTLALAAAAAHQQFRSEKLANVFCPVHNKPVILGQIEIDPQEGPGFAMETCCPDHMKRVMEILSSGVDAPEPADIPPTE